VRAARPARRWARSPSFAKTSAPAEALLLGDPASHERDHEAAVAARTVGPEDEEEALYVVEIADLLDATRGAVEPEDVAALEHLGHPARGRPRAAAARGVTARAARPS
jgi:hypothetical protein